MPPKIGVNTQKPLAADHFNVNNTNDNPKIINLTIR